MLAKAGIAIHCALCADAPALALSGDALPLDKTDLQDVIIKDKQYQETAHVGQDQSEHRWPPVHVRGHRSPRDLLA